MLTAYPVLRHKRWLASLLAAGFALAAQAQTTSITVAGFGGNLQKDLSRTLWQPAAQQIGATVREESHDGSLAQLRVQVQSGRPGWDVVHLGSDECAIGANEGLFEPIDYKVVDPQHDIPDVWRAPHWIAQNTYSVVMAWRTDTYKANPPKNWADFWDTKKYPGRRALSTLPSETMEIALLADGVERDKLYPLDTKRALASLGRIKKDVAVWWATGAQSAQLIKDGEVDMIAIYGARVANVIGDGAPVAFTYQDGLLGAGCLGIVKGSKRAKEAQRFVAGLVTPEAQARILTSLGYYGPANPKAYDIAKLSPQALAKSNMAPENKARQVPIQADWWRDHTKEVREPFRTLIAN